MRSGCGITIIGGGAFGTALAVMFGRSGIDVNFVIRTLSNIKGRENIRLEGHIIPESVSITDDVRVSEKSDYVLLAVPVSSLRSVCESFSGINFKYDTTIVACSKGIELETNRFPLEVVQDVITDRRIAMLSGPGFAKELAEHKFGILNFATQDQQDGIKFLQLMNNHGLRNFEYTSDIYSVQVGAAVKNIIAIACGFFRGIDAGEAMHASIVSRGLSEIICLCRALCSNFESSSATCPACLGDLIMTCGNFESRNTTFGYRKAHGTAEEYLSSGVTVEGINTSKALHELTNGLNVELPICNAVYKLVFEDMSRDSFIHEVTRITGDIDMVSAFEVANRG